MSKNIYKKRRTFKKGMPKYEIRDVKDKSVLYGVIESDNPYSFDSWDKLNNSTDHFEVKQFQQIFDGISQHIEQPDYKHLDDITVKLPSDVMTVMVQLNTLAEENDLDFNFSQTMIAAVINLARTVANKLPENDKYLAYHLLQNVGIQPVNRNKSFFNDNKDLIIAIFKQLDSIYNKIEHLHNASSLMFDKQKHYSPELISKFASAEEHPNRWMICSAISVIGLQDESEKLENIIASPGIFVELWVMPLIHTAKKSIIDILSLFDDHFEFTEEYAQGIIDIIKHKI